MMMILSFDMCKIDTYPDAEFVFVGMYEHKKPTGLSCAKSCAGLVITFAKVQILC